MKTTTKPKAAKKPPKDNFKNLHNAKVEVRYVYNGEAAKAGYVWFVWSFRYAKRYINKNKKLVVERCRKVRGEMIEKSFVEEHGEENVKRMIIQNIVNPLKAD